MDKGTASKNISLVQRKNQQLLKLSLVDETTNVEYVVEVDEDDYNHAHKDMIFASMLLEKAKTLSNSENIIPGSTSPINRMVTDNSRPSCSKTRDTVLRHNVNVSNVEDYNEDEFDTQEKSLESSQEKWTHAATLLLISLYKEKSHMLGKHPHKKMWLQIAQCMKVKKYNFTHSQCCIKMDTLKRRYRQVVDYNAQSGNDRKEWIYMETLNDIFNKKHWVRPLSIAGSNIEEPDNSPLSCDENGLLVKRRKMSLNEERANYLNLLLEEKRLKREETAKYRAEKLQILTELKETMQTKK